MPPLSIPHPSSYQQYQPKKKNSPYASTEADSAEAFPFLRLISFFSRLIIRRSKMKSKTIKLIAAFILAAITAFSFIPASTAYAAGEAGAITFDYCYDSSGNMILYNGETYVDGYLAGGTGHPKPRMFVNGETAYCIQPGQRLMAGPLRENIKSTISINQATTIRRLGRR